jgi:Flp pilus assembly protein protease CpaA
VQEKNLRRDQIFSKDDLWVRLHHDEEYLAQMVLREHLSPCPEMLHPDVQYKAWQVAERLGVLSSILAYHATMMGADVADEGTCSVSGGGNTYDLYILLGMVLIIGVLIGIVLQKVMGWLKPTTAKQRTVACQSQTTYTYVRGSTEPRFLPLPEHSHGTFN